jgi:predicted O-methyltransferase YrrM
MKISWSKDYTVEFMELVENEKLVSDPCRFLEIGVFEGRTAHHMLTKYPTLQYMGIDNWPVYDEEKKRRCKELFERSIHGYRDRAILIEVDSPEALINLPVSFDLIYVDGDHTYKGTLLDAILSWELLSPYGYMVFDDVKHPTYPGIKKAVNEFIKRQTQKRQVKIKSETKRFITLQKLVP